MIGELLADLHGLDPAQLKLLILGALALLLVLFICLVSLAFLSPRMGPGKRPGPAERKEPRL